MSHGSHMGLGNMFYKIRAESPKNLVLKWGKSCGLGIKENPWLKDMDQPFIQKDGERKI